jgi:hypothetical protein
MRGVRRTAPIVLTALAAAAAVVVMALQRRIPTQLAYYQQTGHIVREPFLSEFAERGGIDMFGLPMTDAYRARDGALVQTFERAQMTLTVRGVELSPIGVELRLGQPDADIPVDPALWHFYLTRGGADTFGFPLGPAHVENGRLVQDFERVRLVRTPDGGVRLANLGAIYLAAHPAPPSTGQAAMRPPGTPTPPAGIRPSASVERPTIGQGEPQTIYLLVQDGRGQPVEGAQALAVLRFDDRAAEVTLPPTDARGLSRTSFIAPPAAPGSRVIVEVHILAGETTTTIETAYFQWW